MEEQENKIRTLLCVMSVQYEGDTDGRFLNWKKEMKEPYPDMNLPVTITYKSLWKVKPGEQDLVFAGGRQDDEEFVKEIKRLEEHVTKRLS